MKPLTTLIILMLFAGIVKGQYHIRVTCFDSSGNNDGYKIQFTYNNWDNFYELQNASDISEICGENCVYIQEMIFDTYEQARKFALKFHDFYQCAIFNKHAIDLYHQLTVYRKFHPIKPKPEKTEIKECCKTTQIY